MAPEFAATSDASSDSKALARNSSELFTAPGTKTCNEATYSSSTSLGASAKAPTEEEAPSKAAMGDAPLAGIEETSKHSRNVLFALATTATFVLVAAHSSVHTDAERARAQEERDRTSKAVKEIRAACANVKTRVIEADRALQEALSRQALARCAPQVRSASEGKLLNDAAVLRSQENAAYLRVRDLDKEMRDLAAANDQVGAHRTTRDRQAAESRRAELAEKAVEIEKQYYQETRKAAESRARGEEMHNQMVHTAQHVLASRTRLDAAAAERDECEGREKAAAAEEDEMSRRVQTLAQKTSDVVKLPILGNEVQSGPFFSLTPWLIVTVYVYLRLYLSELHVRLLEFDSWALERNWSLKRRSQTVHPWVGTFAFYRSPVACAAMFIGATWGTPFALALMYNWQQPSSRTGTRVALLVSILLALLACVEARNPSGVRIAGFTRTESDFQSRLQLFSIWLIWLLGSLGTVGFLWAYAEPDSWKRLMALASTSF